MVRRVFIKSTGLALLGVLHYGLGKAAAIGGEKDQGDAGRVKSKVQPPKYYMSGYPGCCAPSSPTAFLREV
jgi:hypothetical protein